MTDINDRFAVVLAGGDGSRLKSLTRTISGDDRPKQFCPILNGETLLDITKKRVELKVKPENVYYSLTQKHEFYYKILFSDTEKMNLIVQPENKGTAPAILYSLMRLASHNPEAIVAFFPSDHYFSDDDTLMDQVENAFKSIEKHERSVILLGIEPDKAEPSYGWIEPRRFNFTSRFFNLYPVKRFWEKPTSESAGQLFGNGCLWNSFIMIGKVTAFLEIIKKHLPDMFRMFKSIKNTFGTPTERQTIPRLYDWINETNFSSEVLEKSSQDLFVMPVTDVHWSDWGEPQRVLQTLTGLGIKMDWMRLNPNLI